MLFRSLGAALVGCHSPHDPIDALLSSEDGKYLLIAVRGTVMRSVDGGRSWTPSHVGLQNPLPSEGIAGSATISANHLEPGKSVSTVMMLYGDGDICKSNNKGRSWESVFTAEQWASEDAGVLKSGLIGKRIALSRDYADNQVVIVPGKRLMRSSNGGKSFEPAHTLGNGGHFTAVFSSRTGLFAGTSHGQVFHASAMGEVWTELTQLSDSVSINSLEVIHLQAGGYHVTVGSKKAIYTITLKESSSGLEVQSKAQLTSAFKSKSGIWGQVLAGSLKPGHVFYTSDYTCKQTKDGGKTWHEVGNNEGLHAMRPQTDVSKVPTYTQLQVLPQAGLVYLGTFTGLYVSVDGGSTWIKSDTVGPWIEAIAVSPTSRGHIVAACTYVSGCFHKETSLSELDMLEDAGAEFALDAEEVDAAADEVGSPSAPSGWGSDATDYSGTIAAGTDLRSEEHTSELQSP